MSRQTKNASANREIPLAIPGLAEAAAESSDAAARIEGERLSLLIQVPEPKAIGSQRLEAGPLFRGTVASSQNELFVPGRGKRGEA